MMNCLIVDDEPLALAQLAGYISRIPFLKLIASCQDAHQASKVLASHTIDLLFVDINMPDLNGIEFVRSLPQAPMIIFTTAYSEYAIEGFRLNAVDYLMKPFDLGDCLKAAEKARKMYSMAHNTSQAQTDWDDKERTLFVKSEYKMIRINIDKIIYIESMSEYICIYLEDRNKPVITLNSLQKFSTLLPLISCVYTVPTLSICIKLPKFPVFGFSSGKIHIYPSERITKNSSWPTSSTQDCSETAGKKC